MNAENRSEVARLRQQIVADYEASQRALSSPAMVGRHAFLTARQENIGRHFEALTDVLGSKEEAILMVAETLDALSEAGSPHAQL